MIECEYKHVLPIMNLGVVTTICMLHGKSVNDDICSGCKDRCGQGYPANVEMNFPRRPDAEIAAVYAVCKACPLFGTLSRECSRLKTVGHPTDVYAQNPANRCPDGHW